MAAKSPEHSENQCPFHAERSGEVREVGSQAVWSLSSCKPGEFLFVYISVFETLTNLLKISRIRSGATA